MNDTPGVGCAGGNGTVRDLGESQLRRCTLLRPGDEVPDVEITRLLSFPCEVVGKVHGLRVGKPPSAEHTTRRVFRAVHDGANLFQ